MTKVSIEDARRDLGALVRRALAGEEIVIEADEAEAVKLAPVTSAPVALPADEPDFDVKTASYRGRGILKGKIHLGPEFFEPLSDEECGLGPDEPVKP